jgi:putative transposase
MSERRACRIVSVDRKVVRYRSRRPPNAGLRARKAGGRASALRLSTPARAPSPGGPGEQPQADAATLPRGGAERASTPRSQAHDRARAPLLLPALLNTRWSIDFVHDQLARDRHVPILDIIDDVTKECLAAAADTSISGKRVARELDAIGARRGWPGMIVSAYVTEFTSNAMLAWGVQTASPGTSSLQARPCKTESTRASTGTCGTSC